MFRYIRIVLMGVAALWGTGSQTLAAEVTMRLRGSALTFTGKVISFDGQNYRLDTERFGKVNLNVRKFECVAGACPVAAAGSAATAGPNFGVHGSTTVGSKLMPALISAYAKSVGLSAKVHASGSAEANIELLDKGGTKVANINLKYHGSESAFSALAEGQAQIGISSRPIKANETDLLSSSREHVLALDGLLVIVSPQSSLSFISIDQLGQVFSGEISDWSQLGQKRGQINVYARNVGSGTIDTFKSLVLDPSNRQITSKATRVRSDAELSDAVARDPQGIGVTSFAYKRSAKALAISTACGITYSPTVFNVKAAEHPLSRRLFLYTTSALSAKHAKGLLDYALSDRAQKIVSGAGFIDQSVEYLAFKNQGDRILGALDTSGDSFDLKLMRQLIKEIGRSSRISMTFRFRTASFGLDSRSQQQIKRLAALLSSVPLHDKEILLLGFSDEVGAFDRNRELSLIRARQVKQTLLSAGGGRINEARVKVMGYGELLPVGCNTDPLGRAKNRRVEVWVRSAAVRPQQQKLPQVKKLAKPDLDLNSEKTKKLFLGFLERVKPDSDLSEEETRKLFRAFLEWSRHQQN